MDLASLGLIIWLMDLCKKKKNHQHSLCNEPKRYISYNHLAHGLRRQPPWVLLSDSWTRVKEKVTTSRLYVMSQKDLSDIIVWLTDLKESLVWSYYLAHGLVQKKEVTLSTFYVMSQKDISDIIIWLTDLAKNRLLRQII